MVDRARIIQAAATGQAAGQIAAPLGCSRPTVYTWIRRYNEHGVEGLQKRHRSGRPHTYTAEERSDVIAVALNENRDKPARLELQLFVPRVASTDSRAVPPISG